MKALTSKMIEMLMDCHERELLKLAPQVGIAKTKSAKGLLNRGLVRASPYKDKATGKLFMAYFITGEGKNYLTKITK